MYEQWLMVGLNIQGFVKARIRRLMEGWRGGICMNFSGGRNLCPM
jgi:hypothetical protein